MFQFCKSLKTYNSAAVEKGRRNTACMYSILPGTSRISAVSGWGKKSDVIMTFLICPVLMHCIASYSPGDPVIYKKSKSIYRYISWGCRLSRNRKKVLKTKDDTYKWASALPDDDYDDDVVIVVLLLLLHQLVADLVRLQSL